MDKVRLGRTNVDVSVVGLGCGGHSRLGLAKGMNNEHAAGIVCAALDLGVTFIDTARAYGTEAAVGMGLKGRRDQVFVSTKSTAGRPGEGISAAALTESLEGSLKRLGTDHVDVFHLHGVQAGLYDHCVNVLLPEMKRQQEKGKIRFLGITEQFVQDTDHKMLQRALPDAHFDIVMIGFNLLNPAAHKTVFPLTQRADIGTLIMFAVRRAISNPQALRELVADVVKRGQVKAGAVNAADPLDFVRAAPGVKSEIEAAYRYCRHEPGAQVILTGTSDAGHLKENVASILAPKLLDDLLRKLDDVFGQVDSVSGN
jgi:aryl-alcohol dehydrogenase-like predicted oxidoreductase